MISRLLHLFPQFRALELRAIANEADAEIRAGLIAECEQLREALQQSTTEKLLLQDRLDAAQESVSQLWSMVAERQQRADRAMEMQVNFATQQRFGIVPYPEATQLPESAGPMTGSHAVSRRQLPSEMMDSAKARFMPELIETLNSRRSKQ
jgi:hypothetical protein